MCSAIAIRPWILVPDARKTLIWHSDFHYPRLQHSHGEGVGLRVTWRGPCLAGQLRLDPPLKRCNLGKSRTRKDPRRPRFSVDCEGFPITSYAGLCVHLLCYVISDVQTVIDARTVGQVMWRFFEMPFPLCPPVPRRHVPDYVFGVLSPG